MRGGASNPWPYLFLAPFGVAFAVLGAYPLGRTLWLAMHRDAGTSAARFEPTANLAFVLGDPLTWLALANTLGFALGFAIVQVPAALLVAVAIDAAHPRLRRILAGVFFAAHLVGATFAGVLFAAMLSGRRGLLNAVLLRLNLVENPVPWLDSPALAMPVLIGVAAYVGVGFGVVICLAALRRVDAHLLEAATLDGAGPARRVWHVTLPQVRPTLSFLAVAAVFYGLQAFELPYALFGGPGPGYRALTAVMYLFALDFERGQTGLAAAVAVVLAAVVAAVTLLLARLLRVGGGEVTLA